MKRRGSFKVMPGFKANWTLRSGLSSVTIGGVNIRARSGGGSRSRGQTRAETIVTFWQMRPGTHYVRIYVIDTYPWEFTVDGSQLTFDRVKRIMDAHGHHDSATMARAFKTFVKRWNIIDDDGKPIPITQRGIETVGLEMVNAITIELVCALDIPKEKWDRAMTMRATGQLVPVQTSTTPFLPFDPKAPLPPSQSKPAPTSWEVGSASGRTPTTPTKSGGVAFALWLILGLFGGHRYYLGRPGSGFLMTITIGGLGLWWILDLLLLPGMMSKANAKR